MIIYDNDNVTYLYTEKFTTMSSHDQISPQKSRLVVEESHLFQEDESRLLKDDQIC